MARLLLCKSLLADVLSLLTLGIETRYLFSLPFQAFFDRLHFCAGGIVNATMQAERAERAV
jgi:hypothetical protein